jgi:hypothetical protein
MNFWTELSVQSIDLIPTESEVWLTHIPNLSCYFVMEPSVDLTGVFLLYSVCTLSRVRHLRAKQSFSAAKELLIRSLGIGNGDKFLLSHCGIQHMSLSGLKALCFTWLGVCWDNCDGLKTCVRVIYSMVQCSWALTSIFQSHYTLPAAEPVIVLQLVEHGGCGVSHVRRGWSRVPSPWKFWKNKNIYINHLSIKYYVWCEILKLALYT